jgi:hypothetical protein
VEGKIHMKKTLLGGIAAGVVASTVLGMGTAHADPTIEIPSWMGGDHNPYPLMAAMQKWDPTASGMTPTQAANNAVIYCSLRHDGHSEAWVVEQMGDGDEATFRPVLYAAEQHFCPQYF